MVDLFNCDLLSKCLQIYVDNLDVFSNSKKEHLTHLRETLVICRESNLHIRREKCSFLQTKIQTLGFVVSHNLIEPDPTKIDMLLKASTAQDKTSLRAFLSFLQYFRKMLVHLSHTCHSLYQLTSPNTKFVWTEVHNNAFLAAKDMISNKILNTRFDTSKNQKCTLTPANTLFVLFFCETNK
jgi:hypothetical protein